MTNVLEQMGDFTRIGFELFFVETAVGNFVYDRLNGTLSQYGGSYYSYLDQNDIIRVKPKGRHKIQDYCKDVKVL